MSQVEQPEELAQIISGLWRQGQRLAKGERCRETPRIASAETASPVAQQLWQALLQAEAASHPRHPPGEHSP